MSTMTRFMLLPSLWQLDAAPEMKSSVSLAETRSTERVHTSSVSVQQNSEGQYVGACPFILHPLGSKRSLQSNCGPPACPHLQVWRFST